MIYPASGARSAAYSATIRLAQTYAFLWSSRSAVAVAGAGNAEPGIGIGYFLVYGSVSDTVPVRCVRDFSAEVSASERMT